MTMLLTDSQRDYLKREPLTGGQVTKIRLAARLADVSLQALAEAVHCSYPQLAGYVRGGDLLLSTAWRIADHFGLSVCDLWPEPPSAKRATSKAYAAAKAKAAGKARATRRSAKDVAA